MSIVQEEGLSLAPLHVGQVKMNQALIVTLLVLQKYNVAGHLQNIQTNVSLSHTQTEEVTQMTRYVDLYSCVQTNMVVIFFKLITII